MISIMVNLDVGGVHNVSSNRENVIIVQSRMVDIDTRRQVEVEGRSTRENFESASNTTKK